MKFSFEINDSPGGMVAMLFITATLITTIICTTLLIEAMLEVL